MLCGGISLMTICQPVDAIESTVEDEWADLPEMADVWFGRDCFDKVGDIDVFRV